MDGLILVSKHQGCTSHDIIIEIRKILNIQKIGHFGTLDPLATGLMLVAVGKATRFFSFFLKLPKRYEGQIRLGFSTNTYDSSGEPTSTENKEWPEEKLIQGAMKKLEGEINQIPPSFSAKKHKGKPLYKLAREKKEVTPKPSTVFIHHFKLKKYHPPFIDFEAKCSSGTYIRSLAHDLGQILGCGAHLSGLVRTEIGTFRLSRAFSPAEIKRLAAQKKLDDFLIPLESILPQFPKVILKDKGSVLVKNGNLVSSDNILKMVGQGSETPESEEEEMVFRLFSREGKLLALAKKEPEKNVLHPFLVIVQ